MVFPYAIWPFDLYTFVVELLNKRQLTNIVLCKFECSDPNMSFPHMVAIVGKIRAPHRTLVADIGSAIGMSSVGTRGSMLLPISGKK